MDMTALLLSRVQFAFTITFHIIFPSFTIGLAAWLTVLEALRLATGRLVYRVIFDFWLKIFAVAFGLGVVSGIVMAFQFGTNWSVLSKNVRADPRPAPDVRDLHHLHARGLVLRRADLWTQPRAAVVLFVFNRDEAAAPQSSLMFMFWGGVVVFPLTLLYTLLSYSVFRGKVATTAGHY
jgi:cytochrome bd-type quinol oxidase subunit 2